MFNVIYFLKLVFCTHVSRYYALELCSGSLDQLFLRDNHPKKYRGPALPTHLIVLLQLALGLEYIHSKLLVHRDIKPQNVLIHVSDSVAGSPPVVTLKWANFRLGKPVSEQETYMVSGTRSTFSWTAPELLTTLVCSDSLNDNDESRGTVKSDVFSTGCIFFYFLLDGVHP